MTIEQNIKDAFQKIFSFKNTRFNAPSDSQEQECLFIEIDTVDSQVKDNILKAKVMGKCAVFGQADKLPVSYFAQRLGLAKNDLTKDFFFYDLEGSLLTEMNIVKRSFSFIYFFAGQYNPHADNIESIVIEGLDA